MLNRTKESYHMNTGISLSALAAKIEAENALKKDFISPTTAMSMTDDAKGLIIGGQGEFKINGLAHDQIGSRLGIPAKYYDRMMEETPHLLAANVNTWLGKKEENRMVRTLDGTARAFLSDRYQRVDNYEIAEVALPVLSKIPNVQIVSTQITERRMYIQAVSPRLEGEVKRGDVVQAGVIISNSEVGAGAISVAPMIYRLVCLNGLIIPDQKFKAYHVGRKIEDNEALWADDTRKADDRAVLLKVRDMVAAAVDEANFKKTLDSMRETTEARITGNPAESVKVLGKTLNATEAEQGGILRSLIEGGDLSAWGVINAVTAQAHTAQYDRAVELENAGGMLLNLDRKEWSRILEAA